MSEQQTKQQQIRKEKQQMRSLLTKDERTRFSAEMMHHLLIWELTNPCEVYFLYASYQSEAETDLIAESLLNMGKRVFYPRVEGKEICFYEIHQLEELISGFRGIREPYPAELLSFEKLLPRKTHIRILLPGSAFDPCGNRIGYGGGYYDRFLGKWDCDEGFRFHKIGLCYSCQLTDGIPAREHDRVMDALLMESGIYELYTDR